MNIYEKLSDIFQETFDNDDIIATPELTANEVEEWDSLSHIRVIVAIEEEFVIKFSISEIVELKNVGEMAALIESKVA
jgi:acyl carrier protein